MEESKYEVKKLEDRTEYYYEGKLHRNDGPAIEYISGRKYWYQNGLIHRLDGPAVEYANGSKSWYIEGQNYTEEEFNKKMEESKYEIKKFDNRTEYYYEGKLHRDNDLPAIEFKSGNKYWYQNGREHRDNGPAVEYVNGTKFWYQNDKCHRLDGPAIENKDGSKYWYIEGRQYSEEEYNKIISGKNEVTKEKDNLIDWQKDVEDPKIEVKKLEDRTEYYKDGELHREDGPAYKDENGNKSWYQNGQLHRLDGPAKECSNGDKIWYKHGELHREDGPACDYADGSKEWWKNGEFHRLDGPAEECVDGDKFWWIEGQEYTEEEFNNIIGKKVENKMNKENIKNTIKDRMEKAAYRSASRNIIKGIAKSIVAMLKDKGTDEGTLSIISAFFETEFGESLIGMILGLAIPQIPMLNEDERAMILAEEFQVESTSKVMDAVINEVSEYILPVISNVLNKIPGKKTRALLENTEIEEEIVNVTNKSITK